VYNWARTRRATIIRACLMLVRAWVNDGRPADKEVVRGSFESWCEVIGGIMKHAGFTGLPAALKATNDRDASLEDHRLLLRAWANKFGFDQAIPAFTVGELAAEFGLYDNVLPKKYANNTVLGRSMYKILWGGLIGQCLEGMRVDVSPTMLNGYTGYKLVQASESAPMPPKPGAKPN
jgi:hypothetical protein